MARVMYYLIGFFLGLGFTMFYFRVVSIIKERRRRRIAKRTIEALEEFTRNWPEEE